MAVGSGARMTATATMHNCKANIGSAQGHWPYSVLDVIVVDRQIAILDVADQRGQTSQAVVDRLPCCRAIRDLAALAGEPLPQSLCHRL